jgi:acyl-CoA thioester hydrolase
MAHSELPGADGLDLADPATYDIWTHEIIRFGDTDAFGHVNNGSYAAYFENARVKLSKDLPIAEGLDWVLARLCLDFYEQLYYPGEVDVGTRLTAVGQASFGVAQGVFCDGTCRGAATGVMVLINLESGRSAPMPDHVRAAVTELYRGSTTTANIPDPMAGSKP